jgi:TATA element modulatory factor
MLQTQHAIASQNWQRIEGSLQHRNEALEREKLELLKKLDDEKRKLREAVSPPFPLFLFWGLTLKADAKRAVQNQLDDQKRNIKSLESDLLKTQSQIQTLHETIATLETRLTDQTTSFTKEKDALTEQFEQTLDARLKEEKSKWEEDSQVLGFGSPVSTPITPFAQLVSSPGGSRPSRARNSMSPQPETMKQRGSFPPSRATSFAELTHLRRPSRHFFDASPSLPPPPLEDEDEREFLEQSRGESPKNIAVDAVSISASTSTAGPSVNIIERMSAAVRRLESDLTSAKEELTRSVRQRDEAREECHKLMVEVEEKRRCQDAQRQIQAQFDHLEVRYGPPLFWLDTDG